MRTVKQECRKSVGRGELAGVATRKGEAAQVPELSAYF